MSGTSTTPPFNPNEPQIITGKIENLLQFPATKLSSTSTKTINIKTTDIVNDLTLIIGGNDANMFNVSAGTISKDTANGSNGINITINYHPLSVGTHSAILTISGGGLNPDKVIILNGTGF